MSTTSSAQIPLDESEPSGSTTRSIVHVALPNVEHVYRGNRRSRSLTREVTTSPVFETVTSPRRETRAHAQRCDRRVARCVVATYMPRARDDRRADAGGHRERRGHVPLPRLVAHANQAP